MTSGVRLEWDDKQIRKRVRTGTRRGLQVASTRLRREHRQALSRKRVSRPGEAPGKRSGALAKMPRKKVRSIRGSLRMEVGFLPGASSGNDQKKAMALTHGGQRANSRGGPLDPRPSIPEIWKANERQTVTDVLQAIRAEVGD